MSTPTRIRQSPARRTPVFPQINIGSYTGSPIGSPPAFLSYVSQPSQDHIDNSHGNTDDDSTSYHSHDSSNQPINIKIQRETPLEGAEQDKELETSFWTKAKQKDGPRHIITLIILFLGNISSAMLYSLLAPFYPTEAAKKGMSSSEVGIVFGSFQLIQLFMCPVFGYHMTKLGSKFLFVSGNFVCSFCGILFGCLQWCPNGHVYLAMCFVVRSVESIGAASSNTAAFSIAAYTFPGHISLVMGILQAGSCIGLMSGPPIGGLLYGTDSFYRPFLVTGSMFMFFSLASAVALPSPKAEEARPSGSIRDKLRFLRMPIVLIVGLLQLAAQATMGYMDVGLAPYLDLINMQVSQKHISAVLIGLVFLVPAGIVVLTAPMFGLIADKHKILGRPFMIFGTVVGGLAFACIGPSPLLPFSIHTTIKSIIISLAVSGVGWGSLVVLYQEYVTAAKLHGFPDGMETQGIISGVNGAFNSLGSLLGPTVGGLLNDHLGFPWTSTGLAGLILLAGMILVMYMIIEAVCCRRQTSTMTVTEQDETSPLLANT